MFYRFGDLLINLEYISTVKQLTEKRLRVVMTNGEKHTIKSDYDKFTEYLKNKE